jgi:hypothetical protein
MDHRDEERAMIGDKHVKLDWTRLLGFEQIDKRGRFDRRIGSKIGADKEVLRPAGRSTD